MVPEKNSPSLLDGFDLPPLSGVRTTGWQIVQSIPLTNFVYSLAVKHGLVVEGRVILPASDHPFYTELEESECERKQYITRVVG